LVAGRADANAAARVTALWQGWLTSAPYERDVDPAALDDEDHDGVPTFYERVVGTDPTTATTTGDGWTDLAHVILGAAPGKLAASPQVIVPDGDFSDWQELLPKRLIINDTPKTSACPKAAAIRYYAAITTHDDMIVGAEAEDFWESEPAARWELDLDFTKEYKQFLVVAPGEQRQYQVLAGDTKALLRVVQRAIPLARKTFEIAVNRQDLLIPSYLDAPDEVKIRLRTVYTAGGKDLFCDETDWFSPYIAAP
jgi:hypothetical protein